MRGEGLEHGAVSLSIRLQPGLAEGRWQVTLTGANGDEVMLFSGALELVSWLEHLEMEQGPRRPERGLR
ncbi:hypothetical protein Q0M94_17240 (plasmid) [Deinococcus radiomollis]|uniref:hypothetical protein n=1 Tax=Deinococcus radiomollis TaxID=468916 RepID=UPI003891B333